MKKNYFIFFSLLFALLLSNLTGSANPFYTLAAGEEFVYGKIGTFEDGSLKYTLAIVRKRNENKTFYRMGFQPYQPRIVQGGGNLKAYENPRDYHQYDVYLIFNGQKFGPYDEVYDMDFTDPDPDEWVSDDGKTISFCGQKGKKFMGVVHNTERSTFWVPSQALNIDVKHPEDIFTVAYGEGDVRMYRDGQQIQTQLNYFKTLKHSANGNLLYAATDKASGEKGLYLNHQKIDSEAKSIGGDFIPGTDQLYYIENFEDGSKKLHLGSQEFYFNANDEIAKIEFIDGYVSFVVRKDKTWENTIYEYDLKTQQMHHHGPYLITRMAKLYNPLGYAIMHQSKENDAYVHTYTFLKAGGEVIEKYIRPAKASTPILQIAPSNDIYIIKRESPVRITKNGKPYPFDGNVEQVNKTGIMPSSGQLYTISTVKSEFNNMANNAIRIDIGDQSYFCKGHPTMYIPTTEAPVLYTVNRAAGEDNRQNMLFKNCEPLLNETWKHIEQPAISANGEHFAVMVFNYGDKWQVNSIMGYYPTNGCMHQDWHLLVDGKEMPGNYGFPAYLKDQNKLVALKQEGNQLVVKDLLSNQNINTHTSTTASASGTEANTQSSFVNLQNHWKKTCINVEQGLTCGDIAPGWHSAMWILEPSENGYVKIKNRWKGTYLHIEGGLEVQCSEIQPGWHSAMWLIERIPGTNEVRLKNRWKGTYLNIEHGSLHCTDIQPGWLSARWNLNPVQ